MLKTIYQFVLSSFLLLVSLSGHAEVKILITDGVNNAKPIAVLPFTWLGVESQPQDIGAIISADLRNSGKFNPISRDKLPEIPQQLSQVHFDKWRALGVDSLIMGSIQQSTGDNYIIHFQLIDTVNHPGDVLAENRYQVSKRWLRYAAHTASDKIFETLTGIKGDFRTRIAYIVKTNKAPYAQELRVADYDGYNQITLHRSSQPLMSPAWSPDGKELAYVTFESGHATLVVKNLATGAVETLANFPQHNGAPAFSHDGKKLAFASSQTGSLKLYIMDLASKKVRQLTYGRSNDTEPSWLADDTSLVYTSDQGGRPQLYTVNVKSGATQRLTWQGMQNQDASASSDGRFIIMVTTTDEGQFINRYDLSTQSYQMLTHTLLDETPSISPNNTMIIYSSSQGLGTILNLVSADGRFKAKLPATDGQVSSPAWSPYL